MNKEEKAYLTGRIPLPEWIKSKRMVPYVYGTYAQNQTLPKTYSVQMDDDSYFLVDSVCIAIYQQGSPVNLYTYYINTLFQITDTTQGRPWSNAALTFGDVSGMGVSPRVLKEPNILFPGTIMRIYAVSGNAGFNNFYAAFFGRKVYGLTSGEVQFLNARLSYQFSLATGGMNVNGKASFTDAVYKDSDFLVKRLLGSSNYYSAVDNLTEPPFQNSQSDGSTGMTFNIFSQKAQKYMFNQPVPFAHILGSYTQPVIPWIQTISPTYGQGNLTFGDAYHLKKPFLVKAGDALEVQAQNLYLNPEGFSLVLDGVRMFQ